MTNIVSRKVIPAIMIGGSGTRLWPLSRANMPKQFLRLTNDHSLFQNTLLRARGELFEDPWLLTGDTFMDLVGAQMREVQISHQGVIVEPLQRGTAAALAAVAVAIGQADPDALILAVPADHVIRNDLKFRSAIERAMPIAAADRIVTFGIVPTAPETGFGYIRPGEAIYDGEDAVGAHVEQPGGFLEKPNAERAAEFVRSGFYWNAGIFLFKASTMLEELAAYAPETLAAVDKSIDRKWQAGSRPHLVQPAAAEFALCPPDLPIDTAVMEKSKRVAVVPCDDIGWADIGSLSALWEIHEKDHNGNVIKGNGLLQHAKDCFVYSTTERRIVVGHARDIMVIDTEDAVVVMPREQAQTIKDVVGALKILNAPEVAFTRSATTGWGAVRVDSIGENSQSWSVTIEEGSAFTHGVSVAGSEIWILNMGEGYHEVNGTRHAFAPGVPVILERGDLVTISAGQVAADFTLILHATNRSAGIAATFAIPPDFGGPDAALVA